MKTWIIAALAVSIGSAVVSVGAHARTWHVNSAGTGDAPSIAAALDSCAAGDSVLVAAGNYQIDSHLFIQNERVTLVSEAGAAGTVLHGATPVVLGVGDESVVEGFTFNSIYLTNSRSWTHGGRISKNICRGGIGDQNEPAMEFWEHDGMTISGNCICSYGGYEHGGYVYGGGVELSESSGFIFDHNTITACGTAISLDGTYPWNAVRNNIIVGNKYGINLSMGAASWGVSCNDVFGNSIANYQDGTDPTGTNGNISVDPQFCAVDPPASGNFLLQSDSPCTPGHHPDGTSCGLIGACPVGCGTVSVKPASWGTIKSIFR